MSEKLNKDLLEDTPAEVDDEVKAEAKVKARDKAKDKDKATIEAFDDTKENPNAEIIEDLNDNSIVIKAPQKVKNNNLLIIIVVLIILLLCGVVLYFRVFSASAKIKSAAKAYDVNTVCELYPKLKNSSDKQFVQDSMFNYAYYLKTQFKDGVIDYYTAKAEIDELGKEVLLGDARYDELVKDLDSLKLSNDSYTVAEYAFANNDYQNAYDYYLQVIDDDPNFADAQLKMETCKENLIPVIGKWKCHIDIGDALLTTIGADEYGYDIDFPFDFVLDLNEDGSGSMGVDEKSFNEALENNRDDIVEAMYGSFEQETGLSRDEIDERFENNGYGSLAGFADELIFNIDVFQTVEFYYHVMDDTIEISPIDMNIRASSMKFYLSGDYLFITDWGEENTLSLEEYGITLPLYFEK